MLTRAKHFEHLPLRPHHFVERKVLEKKHGQKFGASESQ